MSHVFKRLATVVAVHLSLVRGLASQETGLILATPVELNRVPLASTPYSGAALPPSVDLSEGLPTPGDQGQQKSCVAWAVAYALKTFQEHEETASPLRLPDGQQDPSRHFSPAFIYNQINRGIDAGSTFNDALNLIHDQGAAPMDVAPYNDSDFATQPSPAAKSRAATYRIDFWRQVNVGDPVEVKAHLNARYPVLIGVIVDQGLEKAGPGFVWRQYTGSRLGGHAMLVVGYNDRRNAFRVMNSWGPQWGDQGYFWFDYQFFGSVVSEGYVAKDAANGPGPAPGPAPGPTPDPTPAPSIPPAATATLTVGAVIHNIFLAPGDPGMRFNGALAVPAGTPGGAQVVIQIYFDAGGGAKGAPVASFRPQFSTIQGLATTGTPPLPIPQAGVSTTWFAVLPYFTLNVPRGGATNPIRTNLVAETVLYINSFGVATGPMISFFVRL